MGRKLSAEEFERQHPRDRLSRTGKFVKKPRPSIPDLKTGIVDYVNYDDNEHKAAVGTPNDNHGSPPFVKVKWVTRITTRFDRQYFGNYKSMAQPANKDFVSSKETWEEYISVEDIPTAETYSKTMRNIIHSHDHPKSRRTEWQEGALGDREYVKERRDGSRYITCLPTIIRKKDLDTSSGLFSDDESQQSYPGSVCLDVRRVEAPSGIATSSPPPVSKNKRPKDFIRAHMKIEWEKQPDGRWVPNADQSIDMTVALYELAGKKGKAFEKQSKMLKGFMQDVRSGVLPVHLLPSVTKLVSKKDNDKYDIAPVDSDLDSLFEYICLPEDRKSGAISLEALEVATRKEWNYFTPIWNCYSPSSERLLSSIKQRLDSDMFLSYKEENLYRRLYARRFPSSVDVEEELFVQMAMLSNDNFHRSLNNNHNDRYFWQGFVRAAELILDRAPLPTQRSRLKKSDKVDLTVLAASELINNMINNEEAPWYDQDNQAKKIYRYRGYRMCLSLDEKTPERLVSALLQNDSSQVNNKIGAAEHTISVQLLAIKRLLEFSGMEAKWALFSSERASDRYRFRGLFGDIISAVHNDIERDAEYSVRESMLTKNIREAIHKNRHKILSLGDDPKLLEEATWFT